MTKLSKLLMGGAVISIMLPALTLAQGTSTTAGSYNSANPPNPPTTTQKNTKSRTQKLKPIMQKATKPQTRTFTGTVTSVSGNSVMFNAKNGASYTADATNAKLLKRFGGAMQLADIQTNDMIQVRGLLADTNIQANLIRDVSLQTRNGTFIGTILSVSTDSFALKSKARGSQTINTTSSTVFKKNRQPAQFSDLAQGQNVRVSGTWDRTNSNVTAKTVTIIIVTRAINLKAALSSVSGNTLTVTGANSTTYTVDTSNAKFVNNRGKLINLADIKTGNNLIIRGKYIVGTTSITANWVRDTSITGKTVTTSTSSTP